MLSYCQSLYTLIGKEKKQNKQTKPTKICTWFSPMNIFQFIIALEIFPVLNNILHYISCLFSLFVFFFFPYFSILNITQTLKSNKAWTTKINSKTFPLPLYFAPCFQQYALLDFKLHEHVCEYCRDRSTQNLPLTGFTWTCYVNKWCSIKRCNLMTALCYTLLHNLHLPLRRVRECLKLLNANEKHEQFLR